MFKNEVIEYKTQSSEAEPSRELYNYRVVIRQFIYMSIYNKEEIEILREGGKRLAFILSEVKKKVTPGVATKELNELAESLIREGGDEPAFLNYRPGVPVDYPATLCVSVNDEIVHGIPGLRALKEGDIVGIDLGLKHRGLFVDSAMTVPVGEIDQSTKGRYSLFYWRFSQ